MTNCPACGAKLETPLGCSACGVLFSPERDPTPFEAFGLEPAFELDAQELRRRLRRFSRLVHPDYHGGAGDEARQRAERASAVLNHAYELLGDPAARADWLVRALGGPGESEQRDLPRAFLMEVLEWNEALEAARESAPGAPARAALGGLDSELRARKNVQLAALGRLLAPLPAPGSPALAAARAELNALRYLETTLSQIEALRVGQASPD